MKIRYLTLLTTLVFLGFTVSAFAKGNKPPRCGDGACTDPETADSCSVDCSGGGSGGGLGSAIPMDCFLGASWGDDPDPGDTINDDELGFYEDEVDKVTCSIGGPSIPWPIRLVVGGGKGKWANVRMVDVVLDDFVAGTFHEKYDTSWSVNNVELQVLYPKLFAAASEDGNTGYPNMDEMDALRLSVRPYRGDPILKDPTQTTESIHRLPFKAEGYEMGMHLSIPGAGLFSISIASKHYEGNETFTGIACDIDEPGYVEAILANSPGVPMRDVSVYLWADADHDGLPDAYTVTTGEFKRNPSNRSIIVDGDGGPTFEDGPGSRYAAVCSTVGGTVHFLGYVNMQFTLTATMQ
jgi:hypothetical protein